MMVGGAALDLLQRHNILVLLFSLVVFPFFTNYITTVYFYKTINSKRQGKKPPTVPYHVPGVFHALGLASLGPKTYFARLIKDYGNSTPFIIRSGTRAFVVVRDPIQIKNILQPSEQLTSQERKLQLYCQVIGAPQTIGDIYKSRGTLSKDTGFETTLYQIIPRKHLTGTALRPNIEVFGTTLLKNLHNKMFQYGTWTQIEDLWSFFQHLITASTIETLFGSEILKQYPRIVRDYWEFHAANDGFLRGWPRFTMPSAFASRDRLHENLAKWIQLNHSGSEFAKLGVDDPTWDQYKGSKFIQAQDEALTSIKSLNHKDRAAEMFAIIHESNSNLIPLAFWTMVEVLRNPSLVNHLREASQKHCPPHSSSYDIAALSDDALIQSIHTEIGRLRLATSTIRTSVVDGFRLDENWVLPKGVPVMIFSHDVAMNTELWAEARPRTVERPLEEFWAERFLIPENKSPSHVKERVRQNKDKIELGHFNMDGLSHLDTAFGGGHLACPGRSFVRGVQAATIAILLNEFNIELCDSFAVDAAMPVARDMAYGSIKPTENIAVRIRKRKMGQRS